MEEKDCVLVELTRGKYLGTDISSRQQNDVEESAASVASVVNGKMLLLGIRRCKRRLFVRFSGDDVIEESIIREQMPYLYNELWDACLDCSKVNLDCVVLDSQGSLEEFLQSESGKQVSVVFNAGSKIDLKACKECSSASVESLETFLSEEAFGVPYVLYDNARQQLRQYEKVALGGTFDHFHNGHKKLLSIGTSVCKGELTVGVTDDSMLGEKKLKEFIEDISTRKGHVTTFLDTKNRPDLRLNIVTIKDVWGPTVVDADIEALVCSTETLKGARLINEERGKRGMNPLEIIAVARSNAYTLSSTFVRKLRKEQTSSI